MDDGLLSLSRHWKNRKMVALPLISEEGYMGRLGRGEHALPLLCTLLRMVRRSGGRQGWKETYSREDECEKGYVG